MSDLESDHSYASFFTNLTLSSSGMRSEQRLKLEAFAKAEARPVKKDAGAEASKMDETDVPVTSGSASASASASIEKDDAVFDEDSASSSSVAEDDAVVDGYSASSSSVAEDYAVDDGDSASSSSVAEDEAVDDGDSASSSSVADDNAVVDGDSTSSASSAEGSVDASSVKATMSDDTDYIEEFFAQYDSSDADDEHSDSEEDDYYSDEYMKHYNLFFQPSKRLVQILGKNAKAKVLLAKNKEYKKMLKLHGVVHQELIDTLRKVDKMTVAYKKQLEAVYRLCVGCNEPKERIREIGNGILGVHKRLLEWEKTLEKLAVNVDGKRKVLGSVFELFSKKFDKSLSAALYKEILNLTNEIGTIPDLLRNDQLKDIFKVTEQMEILKSWDAFRDEQIPKLDKYEKELRDMCLDFGVRF